jgi:hypothetical protein
MQHSTKTVSYSAISLGINATGKILTSSKYCVLIFVLIYPKLWNYNAQVTLFSSPCSSLSSAQYVAPLLCLIMRHPVVQSVTVFLLIKTINVSLNVSFVRHAFSVLHKMALLFYFTALPLAKIIWHDEIWVWSIGGTIQTGQNEVLKEKLVSVPLHQPHIWHFNQASAVRSHWWTAWAMVQLW